MVVGLGTAVAKSVDKLTLELVCYKGLIFTNRYGFAAGQASAAHQSVSSLSVVATKATKKRFGVTIRADQIF